MCLRYTKGSTIPFSEKKIDLSQQRNAYHILSLRSEYMHINLNNIFICYIQNKAKESEKKLEFPIFLESPMFYVCK